MKTTTLDLKQDRQWRATPGTGEKQLFSLPQHFKGACFETHKEGLPKRKADVNGGHCIEDGGRLVSTLFGFKSGLTRDVLGFVCGMKGPDAKRNQGIGLGAVAKTLTGPRCDAKT